MPYSGDAFSAFLVVPASAVAAVIGAVATPGVRGRVLWGFAIVLALASLWLWFKPSPPEWVDLLLRSQALVPIVTVAIVALMRGRVRPNVVSTPPTKPTDPKRPLFAADLDHLSKWKPDISLHEGFIYVGTESRWGKASSRTLGEVRDEVLRALVDGKISGWGKDHPDDGADVQVRPLAWQNAQLTIDKNYAFFRGYQSAAYDLRLSSGELEAAWPRP